MWQCRSVHVGSVNVTSRVGYVDVFLAGGRGVRGEGEGRGEGGTVHAIRRCTLCIDGPVCV